MQVLNSSVARPWKLEQNTSGQASRQALRAPRLWKLEQNNMTKKGPFFGPQNVRKSRRAKMGLPSRAIQHTYVVSPVDMGGLIGVAQTLAVYHYGYLTLKNRTVQEHERPSPPADVAAVFDWGLDTHFTSQDKPPLAIAMIVSLNGERTVRRYRLVLVQKARLRLSAQVTAALTSHNKDRGGHRKLGRQPSTSSKWTR